MTRPTISRRMARRLWSMRQHKHLRRKLPPSRFIQRWIVDTIIDEILSEERAKEKQ